MIKKFLKSIFPFYKDYIKCSKSRIHNLNYFNYVKFRIIGSNIYYPMHKTCVVANNRRVYVGINSSVMRPGCYIQGAGNVYFGDYIRLGPNVGILTSNHDLYDQNKYVDKPIIIRDYCWIGMNSVITAGVELGTRTIVAAGAVVTKSFPEGFCVLAGVPAKIVKTLDKEKFIPWHYEYEYYGYIPKEKFAKVRKKYLDI